MVRIARHVAAIAAALTFLCFTASQAHAHVDAELLADFKAGFPELFPSGSSTPVHTMAVPDIFGPGAVLDVGNVLMKVTNFGVIGNPFSSSSDPSGQWP